MLCQKSTTSVCLCEFTRTVAAQHSRLDQRCRDDALVENTRVSTRQLAPRSRYQHLHTSLRNTYQLLVHAVLNTVCATKFKLKHLQMSPRFKKMPKMIHIICTMSDSGGKLHLLMFSYCFKLSHRETSHFIYDFKFI